MTNYSERRIHKELKKRNETVFKMKLYDKKLRYIFLMNDSQIIATFIALTLVPLGIRHQIRAAELGACAGEERPNLMPITTARRCRGLRLCVLPPHGSAINGLLVAGSASCCLWLQTGVNICKIIALWDQFPAPFGLSIFITCCKWYNIFTD